MESAIKKRPRGVSFEGERAVEAGRAGGEARWARQPAPESVIAKLVAAAPRLTADQKDRLRALLDTPEGVSAP